MRRPRFTIGSLLVFVLFLAVGLAALRDANEVWDSGVLGLTLQVLLGSVLLAVHRDGPRRAYWLGFALFGWTYLALIEVPSIAPRLPTTHALAYLDSLVPGRSTEVTVRSTNSIRQRATAYAVARTSGSTASPTVNQVQANHEVITYSKLVPRRALGGSGGSTKHFLRIGHSLLALILAGLGAVASRSLYLREHRGPVPAAVDLDEVQETSTSSPTS